MGWLVIVIGSIASALGAVYAYSGLDYIQTERGWTAVISGMGLVSAGIIVIAIGILTLQLSKIVYLLKGATQSLVVDDTLVADGTPAVDEAQWEAAESELSETDAPPPLSSPQAQGSAVSVPVTAELPKPSPQPVKPEPGLQAQDKTTAGPITPALSAEDRVSLDWLEVAISDLKDTQASMPMQNRSESSAVPVQSVADKPAAAPPLVAAAHVPAATALPGQQPLKPDVARPPELTKPETVPSERINPVLPHTGLPQPELSAPGSGLTDPVKPDLLHYEPSVVGRYEAAGTSYAMYSDGSVEAENEHGIFRFGSMAELRAFIEQGQDQSARLSPES